MLYEVITERCGRCHTESREETVVACRDCHARDPFSAAALRDQNQAAYHIDKPGLKGVITSYSIHYTKLYDAHPSHH